MNIPTLEGIKESVPQIEVSNESGETYLNAEKFYLNWVKELRDNADIEIYINNL